MAIIESSTPILGGILRVVAALFGKTPTIPEKNLTSRIHARGIVAELPWDLPLKIVDGDGVQHRGVYALNVLIWNRGSQAISPSDFLENAPLRLTLEKESHIIMADSFSNDKQLISAAEKVDDQTVNISFDCINPSDYISVVLFFGGEAHPSVHIQGRVRGQTSSLDHNAEELKASIGDRIAAFFILMLTLTTVVGLPLSTWVIYWNYGFEVVFQQNPPIPPYILGPFFIGISLLSIFSFFSIAKWFERRKYPPGMPLSSDFEPHFWEGIKGNCRTAFWGEKKRLSNSWFSWAEPVVFRPNRNKRQSVDDWLN